MATTRRWVWTLGCLGVLALLVGCGSGTSAPGAGGFAVTGLIGGPITASTTAITIEGFDYTEIVGQTVRVIYTADSGTPFNGGTSATEEVPGTIVSATEIQVTAPAATICGGPAISAYVEVILPSGVAATSDTPIAVFVPPTLTALNGGAGPTPVPSTILIGQAAAEPFTLTGTAFGPVGGNATVTFGDPAGGGTEFNGLPSVDVVGNIVSATSITGTLPTITTPRLVERLHRGRDHRAGERELRHRREPRRVPGAPDHHERDEQPAPVRPDERGRRATAGLPARRAHRHGHRRDRVRRGRHASLLRRRRRTRHSHRRGNPGRGRGYADEHQRDLPHGSLDGRQHGHDGARDQSRRPAPRAHGAHLLRLRRAAERELHGAGGPELGVPDRRQSHEPRECRDVRARGSGQHDRIRRVDAQLHDGLRRHLDDHHDRRRHGRVRGNGSPLRSGHGLRPLRQPLRQLRDCRRRTDQRRDPAELERRRLVHQPAHPRPGSRVLARPLDHGDRPRAGVGRRGHLRLVDVVRRVPLPGRRERLRLHGPREPRPDLRTARRAGRRLRRGPADLQWQNAYPEVGPNGELYLCFFDIPAGAGPAPGNIYFDVDPDGLWDGTLTFGIDTMVATSNVGWKTYLPPQPQRGYGANCQIVSVRAGPQTGRLLLCYTQEVPDDQTAQWSGNPTPNSNTLVVVRISDDGGATWGAEIPVHVDTPEHQFMHWLTCDRATGELYVTWYDCRNDAIGNTLTQRMSASSADGVTWNPELLLAQGQSDASGNLGQDYLEYCGTAAHNGCVYGCWTDFSNFTGDNPDGVTRSDVYVSVYMQR